MVRMHQSTRAVALQYPRASPGFTVEGNEYTTEEIDTVGHVQCTHTHNHCHTIDVAAPWSQRGAITHATEIPGRRCDRR